MALVAAVDLIYHAVKYASSRSLLEIVQAFPQLFRWSSKFMRWLLVLGATMFLCGELRGMTGLSARMIGWLPGRTASVMTVFCLIALAAYARYERTSARRDAAE